MQILANDLKKGDLVYHRPTGFTYRITDNAKGTIRSVYAEDAPYPEHGSCYVWDIGHVIEHLGVTCQPGTRVELSASQQKAMRVVKSAGF